MGYAPGTLPTSALTLVEPGTYLAILPARAYARAKAAFKKAGKTLSVPRGAGGYRSAAVQNAMRAAGLGNDRAAKLKWNLNPLSTVTIAAHPNGTHEDGSSVDLLVNGRMPDASDRALLAKFGFTRPFGDKDPNHFHQDGRTAVAPFAPSSTKPKATPVNVTVHQNDTLSGIAAGAHTSLHAVLALNPKIKDPNHIAVGQKIRVR